MDWTFVLVIILSTFLAVFLILGIVLTVLLIRVTMQIKKVTKSAEKTAINIENIVGGVSRFSSPVLLSKIILRTVKKVKNIKKDIKNES